LRESHTAEKAEQVQTGTLFTIAYKAIPVFVFLLSVLRTESRNMFNEYILTVHRHSGILPSFPASPGKQCRP